MIMMNWGYESIHLHSFIHFYKKPVTHAVITM